MNSIASPTQNQSPASTGVDPLVMQMRASLSSSGYQPPSASGSNTPTSQGGGSAQDVIDSFVSSQSPNTPTTPAQPGIFSNIGTDLGNRAGNIVSDLSQKPTAADTIVNSPALQTTGEVAGGITDVANEAVIKPLSNLFNSAVGTVMNPIIDAFTKTPAGQSLTKSLQSFAASPTGQQIGPTLQSYLDEATKFAAAHPTISKDLGAAANIAGAIPVAEGAGAALDVAKEAVPAALDSAKTAVGGAVDAGKSIVGRAVDNAAGKTTAEILATPEADVPKLNSADRATWFENQKAQIQSQSDLQAGQNKTNFENQKSQIQSNSDAVTAKIKADLASKSEAGLAKADALNKQLATTARDNTLALRPKVLASMGEQSATYRSLVDEAMAGKEGTVVDKQALKDYVDQRFADDPIRAANIKDKLGLTETVDPLSTKPLSTELRKPNTTLGEIYQQTKDLRQTMGGSATSTFSAADKTTDDAIHTLLSYMKDQGVDLSEPNQFWAKYAPVRDQMVSETQPFNQAGTKTKTFANTLVRVAKGTDVNNENFISAVENLVGEPITGDVKNVLSQLDTNEKQMIANKVMAAEQQSAVDTAAEQAHSANKTSADQAQSANKAATDKATSNLAEKQHEMERQIRVKGIVTKVLKGALKYVVAPAVGVDVLKHL